MTRSDTGQSAPASSGRAITAGATFRALGEAAHRSKTRAELFNQGLAIIGRAFQSPYASLYVQADSQLIQEHHHAGPNETENGRIDEHRAQPGPQ